MEQYNIDEQINTQMIILLETILNQNYFQHKQEFYEVGFAVLTAVVMNSSIFWDITPCRLLKVNRHFRGTCHLHLQGRRIS
jgi:hypothetical protein